MHGKGHISAVRPLDSISYFLSLSLYGSPSEDEANPLHLTHSLPPYRVQDGLDFSGTSMIGVTSEVRATQFSATDRVTD